MVQNKINIVRSDPVRVRFQSDNQIRNIKPYGTIVTGRRDLEGEDPIHDFFISIKTKDTKPNDIKRESFKETIDKVLEQFDVRQDNIKNIKVNKEFEHDIKKDVEWYIKVDEKKFAKQGNKYDVFIDKLDFNNPNNKKIGKVKF